MAQNIYDNEEFFAAYGRLERSIEGLNGAAEWPAMRALLPDLRNLRVLDLGCGYGWFCRWARERGATQVEGVDVSERMLARAKASTSDTAITYVRDDLETRVLPENSFDLVYSSLAFHYLTNLDRLLSEVHRTLVPGGRLVFSVEHPIYTAPRNPHWTTEDSGQKTWPVNGYLDEGPRSTDWLAKGVIKYHRTLATYIRLLREREFVLLDLDEWGPTPEQIAVHPNFADDHQRPPFLLVLALVP
jgi:SAM-dependent methyltransferase